MSLIKTLALMAVIGTAVCATYVMLNPRPDASPLPGVAFGLNANMKIGPDGVSGSVEGPLTAPPAPAPSMVNPVQPATATESADGPYSPPGGYPPSNALPSPSPLAPPSFSDPMNANVPGNALGNSPGNAPLSAPPDPFGGMSGGQNPPPSGEAGLGTGANPGMTPAVSPGMALPDAGPRVLGSPPGPSAALTAQQDFQSLLASVRQQINANRLADALLMLSQHYRDNPLTAEQSREAIPLLDQLAAAVVYSRDVGPYHEVTAADTLDSIAQKNEVPAGLLVKINGLDPRSPLAPGQRLKVVRGPFQAMIDLGRQELTLMVRGELYAGRFPLTIGPDLAGREGAFAVGNKTDMTVGTPGPHPVYGTRWIGLNESLGLHGSGQSLTPGQPAGQGCVLFAQRDIEDLFDILSIGSTVVIRR